MRRTSLVITIGLLTGAVQVACTSPAPRRVAVPPRDDAGAVGPLHEQEAMKPLPKPTRENLPRPYDDVPLVTQKPPEERAYVEAYERVGRPRLMVMATGPDGSSPADKSYQLPNVDYSAVETILADWLSANGAVSIISSEVAPNAPVEPTTRPTPAAPESDVDVLVRVQIHPARSDVAEARLVTEAVNTRGGESIGRAVVDVPTPLEKERLNDATRFVARKLMDEMTESWNRMPVGPRTAAPVPATPSREAPAPATPASPAPSSVVQPAAPLIPPPPRSSGPTPPPIVIPPPPSTTTAPAAR